MSKYRWFNFISIVFFLVLLSLLVRPASPSVAQSGVAQSAATLIGLEPTATPIDIEFTPTPPVDAVTLEPTATLEPTETPTPTPEPVPQFSWSVADENGKMPAGGQINIPLRLNISDASVEQLVISAAASGDGFVALVDPSEVGQVQAGKGVNLILNVSAATSLPVGKTVKVVVMADDRAGHSTQTEVNLTVAWEQPITVEFDPKQQPVDPGGLVTSKVEITNRDAVPHEIQSSIYRNQDAPFDYQMPDVPDFMTLQPGEAHKFKFGIQPRLGAAAGNEGKVVFETMLLDVTNKAGKNIVVGDQAQATVAEMYNVELSMTPREQQPVWGQLATYTVVVTNTGSLTGVVKLEASNGPTHYTATLNLPQSEVYLKPGQAQRFTVDVEPTFAGLPAFLTDLGPRFHDLTEEDKTLFKAFLRDRDELTMAATVEQVIQNATVTTKRPERPTIELPTPSDAPQVKTPVGRGPHATTSFTCGACHTSHRSPMADQPQQESSLLLASTVRGLCDTCHDGTGSVYNVEAGLIGSGQPSNAGPIKLGSEPVTTGYHYSTQSYPANHGTVHFVPSNAKQQDIVVSGPGAVSAHPIGQEGTPAGGNATGQLECTSCHDPHGKTNSARLLAINFAGLKISLPFQATYSQSPEESVNLASGSLEACQSCHAEIDDHGAPGPRKLTDSADLGKPWSTYQQRGAGWLPLESEGEPVNQHMVCLTCHTAHGSRASLPGNFEKLMREPFAPIQEKYGNWCSACHDL